MRAITFVVRPPETHPTARVFDGESGLVRERIHNLNLLEDGTMILLGRVRGDLERARQLIEARMDVLGFSISGTDGESGLVYLHTRTPPVIGEFLELPREHEVFFDFPVEGTPDGGLRVVMIGETNAVLQRALADVPAEIDVTVERIGPYAETGDVAALLTDRQREVLDVARELGYYEVPRRATQRDVAERLDLSAATVTEHLQKIEARVFGTRDG